MADEHREASAPRCSRLEKGTAGTPEYSQGTFEVLPWGTRSTPVSTHRYGMSGVNRSACLCAQEFFAVRGMPGTAPGPRRTRGVLWVLTSGTLSTHTECWISSRLAWRGTGPLLVCVCVCAFCDGPTHPSAKRHVCGPSTTR